MSFGGWLPKLSDFPFYFFQLIFQPANFFANQAERAFGPTDPPPTEKRQLPHDWLKAMYEGQQQLARVADELLTFRFAPTAQAWEAAETKELVGK